MAASFDRSLDEIIKSSGSRQNARRMPNGRRHLGKPYNRNGPRRFPPQNATSTSNSPGHNSPPYNSVLTISNKLSVFNLDYGVSEPDLHALFEEFGPIKSLTLHYDRAGRSLGTATVIYEMRQDAFKALKSYNGVPLDGRPMKIEFSLPTRLQAQRIYMPPVMAYNATSYASSHSQQQRDHSFRRGNYGRTSQNTRSNNNAPNSGNNRRERVQNKQPTLEELDAELDAYVSNNAGK